MTVEIDLDNYSIREGDGLLEVCLDLTGQLARDITINITSMDMTAQGIFYINLCMTQNNNEHMPVYFAIMFLYHIIIKASYITTAPEDYLPAMSVVISPADGNRKCFFLTIIDDMFVEDDESFQLTLSSGDSSVIATDSAIVSILDNDQLSLAIELPSYTVLESAGTVEVSVLISGGELQRDVSIMLNTQDGSAVGKN